MTQSVAVRPPQSGNPVVPVPPVLLARPRLLHPRLAAGVAGAGAVSHLFMVMQHASVLTACLAVVMAITCTPCAVSLWRHGTGRSARMLMVMSLAMVAAHGVMLTGGMAGMGGMANVGATAYVGGAATTAHPAHGVTLPDPALALPFEHGTTAMLAVMACDYAAAMLAAAWLFRLRTIGRRRISAT